MLQIFCFVKVRSIDVISLKRLLTGFVVIKIKPANKSGIAMNRILT